MIEKKLQYINCPFCRKTLIRLDTVGERRPHEYWCDHCHVEITIRPDEMAIEVTSDD